VNTVFTATLTTGVQDTFGNSLATDFVWSFRTAANGCNPPPTIVSVAPLNGATGVCSLAVVTATFSEAMDPLSLTGATVFVKQGTTPIAGTIAVTAGGRTLTFAPAAPFPVSVVLTATITAGARAVTGNTLAADRAWSFTTGDRVKAGVAFSGGRIFAGSYDGRLYALDATTGKRRWSTGGLGNLYATPSVAHGRVFVSSTNGRVYALGGLNGRFLWSTRTGSFVYSPVALSGGILDMIAVKHTPVRAIPPEPGGRGSARRGRASLSRRRAWVIASR